MDLQEVKVLPVHRDQQVLQDNRVMRDHPVELVQWVLQDQWDQQDPQDNRAVLVHLEYRDLWVLQEAPGRLA